MIQTLVCANCGNEFLNTGKRYNRKYCCIECQKESQKRIAAWNAKLKRKKKRTVKEIKKIKQQSIKNVVKEAKKRNITYGMMVAEQTKEMVRIEKHGIKDGYRLAKDNK